MRMLNRHAALKRELTAAHRIPYAAHVSPSVVRTEAGDYVQVFRLAGASFQTIDDADLNNWHERLNVLWRNIASPSIALWIHVIRRRASVDVNRGGRSGGTGAAADLSAVGNDRDASDRLFADLLHERYMRRISGETLMQNEIYLSVVYRPVAGVAGGLVSKTLAKTQRGGSRLELADALDSCEKLAMTLLASLARYEPEALGCYLHGRTRCSALLEFLGLLVNGHWQRMPLTRVPLNQALASSRLLFGTETIEYRSATATPGGRDVGNQRISDAKRGRHVQCLAVGAVVLRADPVVCVSHQGDGPGSTAAAIQSHE